MAYMVYFSCDSCGKTGGAWMNQSVPQSRAKEIARERGWQVGMRGYICPMCIASRKQKVRRNENGKETI